MKSLILSKVKDPTLPLVIYGAGMYAQHIFNIFNHAGIEISAICVDDEFLQVHEDTWNGSPIYTKKIIQQKFPKFNLIVGFYSLHQAKNITFSMIM